MPDLSYLPQIALSGIGVGCIYGLIGIGFCVIYNASGIVNFAQGAFVMLGGMLTHVAFQQLRASAARGRRARDRDRRGARRRHRPAGGPAVVDRNATMFVMILATLAAQIVIERLTLIGAGDQPKTLPPLTDLPPLMVGGIAINFQFLWIVGVSFC